MDFFSKLSLTQVISAVLADLDNCCFQLKERTSKGFGYCIVSDPNQFDEKKNYQSKITSLAAAWLTKDEYNDADLVMNLALTCVIG